MIAGYLTRNKQQQHGFQNTKYPVVRIFIIPRMENF